MRVLLTGAAGFIGSHIYDLLLVRGHDVLGMDNLLDKAHGGAGVPQSSADRRIEIADVRDPDALDALLPGVDAVCHQAAVVGHGVDPFDAPDYASHNDVGTAVLLARMHAAGVRTMVLASSMVVYGEGRYCCAEHGVVRPGPRRFADIEAGRFEPPCPVCGAALEWQLVGEEAPVDPRSTYAATKLAQEHLASAWARQTGGGIAALRYHNVYGSRMPRDTPYAGVASLFRSALHSGTAPAVMEDGAQRRDFVHVTDVALANALALESPRGEGALRAYNICSGDPHTVGDMAEELARACGGPNPVIVGGARPGDVRHIVADPARAGHELGFHAQVGFAEGITAFATDELRAPVAGG
ncbi:MAG: NAD-dependent epimerase/dehydratase family protein [Sciscionella sp.]